MMFFCYSKFLLSTPVRASGLNTTSLLAHLTDIIDTCLDDCRQRQAIFGVISLKKKLQLWSGPESLWWTREDLLISKCEAMYLLRSYLGLKGLPPCVGLPVWCSVLVAHGLPYKAAAACIAISQQIWARLNCPSSSEVWTAEIQIQSENWKMDGALAVMAPLLGEGGSRSVLLFVK